MNAETVEIERSLALKMLVSSYVNGFNEFDTTVVGRESSVSVGIYVDREGQSKERAERLATRFRDQIPKLLELTEWAYDVDLIVTVY